MNLLSKAKRCKCCFLFLRRSSPEESSPDQKSEQVEHLLQKEKVFPETRRSMKRENANNENINFIDRNIPEIFVKSFD